jgi:hypothetical protein
MDKLNQTGTALEVKQGIARAFFISAYAEAWEEAPDSSENKRQLGSVAGVDWAVFAPKKNDPAAERAAEALAVMLQKDNGAADLADLYHKAWKAKGEAKELCRGDKDMTAHNFGHYLAMQSMGHGVGLDTAFGDAVYDMVKVAYLEFGHLHLDGVYF